jgi:hypothetical protein
LHDPLAPPDARFPVGLFILLVFLVLWYELPIFVRQSKTSTMQKLEIKDLGFGDAFKHLEVTLSDGTEALIPAEEICEGETPNELGEYSGHQAQRRFTRLHGLRPRMRPGLGR